LEWQKKDPTSIAINSGKCENTVTMKKGFSINKVVSFVNEQNLAMSVRSVKAGSYLTLEPHNPEDSKQHWIINYIDDQCIISARDMPELLWTIGDRI